MIFFTKYDCCIHEEINVIILQGGGLTTHIPTLLDIPFEMDSDKCNLIMVRWTFFNNIIKIQLLFSVSTWNGHCDWLFLRISYWPRQNAFCYFYSSVSRVEQVIRLCPALGDELLFWGTHPVLGDASPKLWGTHLFGGRITPVLEDWLFWGTYHEFGGRI